MSLFHIFLAFIVAAVWGFNFAIVKIGLRELPPFLFCSLRFMVSLLPVFFIAKPAVSWKILGGIATFQGIIKFSLMFFGVYLGMSAGLASLVLQTQIFFTLGIAMLFFGKSITRYQLFGILLAFSGMIIIGIDTHGSTTFMGLLLILAAALAWAIANLFYQQIGKADALAVVVWSSLIPPLPLLAASLIFEGPELIVTSLLKLSWVGIGCIFFAGAGAMWIGASLWGHLTRTYGAHVVAPYSLLIPIFGILSGWLILGEELSPALGIACALVFIGLTVNHVFSLNKQKITKAIVVGEPV